MGARRQTLEVADAWDDDAWADAYDEASSGHGPYDIDDIDPEATDATGLVDFGAVQIPVPPRGSVMFVPEEVGRLQAVHVTVPEGRLSVCALAAPKSTPLWPQLVREIEKSLREGGARVRSFTGDWGRELVATTGDATSLFIGVDGPRWMLYGVATGPSAGGVPLDAELRRLLRGTVVVRGKSPYPVRTVLPLVVPDHLAADAAAAAEIAAANVAAAAEAAARAAAAEAAAAQVAAAEAAAAQTGAARSGAAPTPALPVPPRRPPGPVAGQVDRRPVPPRRPAASSPAPSESQGLRPPMVPTSTGGVRQVPGRYVAITPAPVAQPPVAQPPSLRPPLHPAAHNGDHENVDSGALWAGSAERSADVDDPTLVDIGVDLLGGDVDDLGPRAAVPVVPADDTPTERWAIVSTGTGWRLAAHPGRGHRSEPTGGWPRPDVEQVAEPRPEPRPDPAPERSDRIPAVPAAPGGQPAVTGSGRHLAVSPAATASGRMPAVTRPGRHADTPADRAERIGRRLEPGRGEAVDPGRRRRVEPEPPLTRSGRHLAASAPEERHIEPVLPGLGSRRGRRHADMRVDNTSVFALVQRIAADGARGSHRRDAAGSRGDAPRTEFARVQDDNLPPLPRRTPRRAGSEREEASIASALPFGGSPRADLSGSALFAAEPDDDDSRWGQARGATPSPAAAPWDRGAAHRSPVRDDVAQRSGAERDDPWARDLWAGEERESHPVHNDRHDDPEADDGSSLWIDLAPTEPLATVFRNRHHQG